MAGEEIRINFLPLRNQDIEFAVWRKKYGGQNKEGIYSDLYKNSLPLSVHDKEVRENYWLSFNERNGFEKFICKGEYNNFLTKHFLFYAISEKTAKILDENKFILPERKFRKHIYYVLYVITYNYESSVSKQNNNNGNCMLFLTGIKLH